MSTMRIAASFAWAATQSVSTSCSGCTYAAAARKKARLNMSRVYRCRVAKTHHLGLGPDE
jgi:hypothetical protein